LANCYVALGQHAEGAIHEQAFRAQSPAGWEINTFESGKSAAMLQSAAPA
jgi:hypothetical protein